VNCAHSTEVVQLSIELHVFHQRHVGEPATFEEHVAPAEEAVVAAADPQRDSGVMRERIRQAVNGVPFGSRMRK
jgi:hypothetical protein